MRRTIAVLLVLSIIILPLHSAPKEYTPDEFPQWAHEIRRGETIFFGSLPLTFLASTLAYETSISLGMQPWTTDDTTRTLYLLSSAAALSLTIAIIDHLMDPGEEP